MLVKHFPSHAKSRKKKTSSSLSNTMIYWWRLATPGSSLKGEKYSAQEELNISGSKGFHQEHLLFCDSSRGCVSIPLILVKQLGYCYHKSRAKLRDGDKEDLWQGGNGTDRVKMRRPDLLREGEMGNTKPAARQRLEGKGTGDTCRVNPSPACGNPHAPSLVWSRWEVSVGMGSGWERWHQGVI